MMKRESSGKNLAALLSASVQPALRKNTRMHVGGDYRSMARTEWNHVQGKPRIQPAPWREDGFQLCLGTTAKGLKHPTSKILPIVEYLARRGKIH